MYNMKYMKQVQNIKKLENLSYFDFETVSQVTSISGNTLYQCINRWLKRGLIITLKKGMFTTNKYIDRLRSKSSYLEFISNKLNYPSYLSSEYVLSLNQVLTESVFAYTSITKKKTNQYSNRYGNFFYRNISDSLFTGFNIVSKDGFDIAIATKSKALFDYLYLKLYRNKVVNKELIDGFRLNLDEFNKNDIKEFKSYCIKTGIKKYIDLPNLLFNSNDN